jgi:glycosyltransferase involved in cell wall biosynthesis
VTLKSIVLVSYHFHPSNEVGARRVNALAGYLAKTGIRVIVVSEFGGAKIKAGSEILPGVIAIPVPQPPRLLLDRIVRMKQSLTVAPSKDTPARSPASQASLAGESRSLAQSLRIAFFEIVYFIDAYKKWSWRAAHAGIAAALQYKACAVFSSGPPMTVLLSGMRISQRLRLPHIADFRDPWVTVANAAPVSRGLKWKLLSMLERRVIRSAAAITCTAPGLSARLRERYPAAAAKIATITNGYDGDLQKVTSATDHRLKILFAGELYVRRNPFPLLAALESLLARPDVDSSRVTMTFVGKCDSFDNIALADWVKGKRCEQVVRIYPPVPSQAVAEFVNDATVLINFAQYLPIQVPAKTFEQLASGREVLVLCEADSDTARIVDAIPGVLRVDPLNPSALEGAMFDLYNRHVLQGRLSAPDELAVSPYSRQALNEQFLRLIRSLAPG